MIRGEIRRENRFRPPKHLFPIYMNIGLTMERLRFSCQHRPAAVILRTAFCLSPCC